MPPDGDDRTQDLPPQPVPMAGQGGDQPTVDHPTQTRKDSEPSTRMFAGTPLPGGRYRILRPHARGGLGQVSVARDLELGRDVALKELQPDFADDPERQARFLMEAELTGALEHPGIVPVYGLGRHADGKPFYAMRFIRGQSLKEAVDQFHGSEALGREPAKRSIEFRRLLRHFLDVCSVIYFAHSRGVLHRDLKPSNIMLGQYGETLVVDWGLAKPLGASDVAGIGAGPPLGGSSSAVETQMGVALGTPAYMSPEQAEGNLTTLGPATDVYGLGATLYYLLTGKPAFQGTNPFDILENVRKGQFERPSLAARATPPPLESICLKAMSLRPSERYPSALALADDVERWLADERVAAHKEPRIDRFMRWLRRHRSWAMATGAALLAVTLISLIAAFSIDRARQQTARLAEKNEVLARQEHEAREQAVTRLRDARAAVDTWLTTAGEVLKHYPGIQKARTRLLEEAAAEYERFASQASDDKDLELERARTYLRLGDLRRMLGNAGAAEAAYSQAQNLARQLADGGPAEASLECASAQIRLGLLLEDQGQHDEADRAYRSAAKRVEELAVAGENSPRLSEILGTAMLDRASLLIVRGNQAEGERLLKKAIDTFAEMKSDQPSAQLKLAVTRDVLGRLLADSGRLDAAAESLRRAKADLDDLVRRWPDNLEYLESRAAASVAQATVLRALGEETAELEAYRAAAADYALLEQAVPSAPRYREQTSLTRTDLGQLLSAGRRAANAQAELRSALPVFVDLVREYPKIPRYQEEEAASRDALAVALLDLGKTDQARELCQAAIKACDSLSETYPDVAQYRHRLAVCKSHLAQAQHRLGQFGEAEQNFREAIQSLRSLGQSSPQTLAYHQDLAVVEDHFGQYLLERDKKVEAETEFRQVGAIWSTLTRQGSASPEHLGLHAWFCVECPLPEFRDLTKARELAARARDLVPRNASFHAALGAAAYRLGDGKAAVESLRRAIDLRPGGHARDLFFHAMAEHGLGNREESTRAFDRACRWMESNCPENGGLRRLRREAEGVLKAPRP